MAPWVARATPPSHADPGPRCAGVLAFFWRKPSARELVARDFASAELFATSGKPAYQRKRCERPRAVAAVNRRQRERPIPTRPVEGGEPAPVNPVADGRP